MLNKKIHCIIQARLTSTRLPGKIFLIGYKKTLIEHLIERLNFSKLIDEVIIASPITANHSFFKVFFESSKQNIFFGSEYNVLERYYKCANQNKSDIIIRVTSDCPLIDHREIDNMIKFFLKSSELDYLKNDSTQFPKGQDIEIFTAEALNKTYKYAKTPYDKEHVTTFIKKNPKVFKIKTYKSQKIKKNLFNKYRMTLDYIEDYILIFTIFNNLYKIKKYFSLNDIINYLNKNKISKINRKYI
jgi:spore coat polysaccharide biosynthesis protein SpsF